MIDLIIAHGASHEHGAGIHPPEASSLFRCLAPNCPTESQEAGPSRMPEYRMAGTAMGICDLPF